MTAPTLVPAQAAPGLLIWVDLETTGLNPETETILEVAAVATDVELHEIASFSMVTNEAANRSFNMLHPVVQKMHTANGLWLESCQSPDSLHAVMQGFAVWMGLQVGTRRREGTDGSAPVLDVDPATIPRPPLAGSTIGFDRSFLARQPGILDYFNHRNLDVSVLTEIAKRWWPSAYATRPGADRKPEDAPHRALADIRESVNLLRHFLAKIGPLPIGEAL